MNGQCVVVEYELDSELRDTEQVPLLDEGGIEGFLRREVLPYAPDAWYVSTSVKIGYEISFTRHFYEPQLMRSREEIRAELTLEGPEEFKHYDVFICHATEDKDDIARPLANALIAQNLRVWYDEFELRIGDSLRRKIDIGLTGSRFGVVIISHSFFAKNWTQYELDGLVTREMTGERVILPIWHQISQSEVIEKIPSLANKVARNTSDSTIDKIACDIAEVIRASL